MSDTRTMFERRMAELRSEVAKKLATATLPS